MSPAGHARGVKALVGQLGRLGRAAALLDAGRELGGTLDAGRIGQITVETIEAGIPTLSSVTARFDPETARWVVMASGQRGSALDHDAGPFASADAPFAADVQGGRSFTRARLRVARRGFDAAMLAHGFRGYLALPLSYDPDPRTVVMSAWAGSAGLEPDERWFLEILAVQATLAMRSSSLSEQLDAARASLERAQDRADHASRLQALGQVASGVAHDFNNSLTTILGLSDWLLHELASDTPFYADLETIRTAAQDAAAMVRRLQMFYRLQPDAQAAAKPPVDDGAPRVKARPGLRLVCPSEAAS